MKVQKIIIILGIMLLWLGCDKKQQIKDEELIYIDIRLLQKKNLILEDSVKYRFLKLETTNKCLIRQIMKIDFDENKMFISDRNNKVFVFDNNGTFLHDVGGIGSGPDEQLSITDFVLDKKNKQIQIFDMLKSTIYMYTYLGELISRKKVDVNIFRDFSSVDITSDNQLVLTMYNNIFATEYNYRMVNTEKYTNYRNCIPYIAIGEVCEVYRIAKTAKSGEILYLSALASDTIYKYDDREKSILPAIVFNGKYKPLTKEDVVDKTFEIGSDVEFIARMKKRSIGIRELYATKKYLHFVFEMDAEIYRCFWNLERQTGSYYRYVCESTIANFFSYVIGATDDAFVCAIPAYEAIRHNWDENQDAKSVIDNTLEDDNPIIAFYYFD
ncbi:MAG: hypothetical protein BGO29_13845 [Bacteroidales bacterium 36-12]|nr:MAG: hypothetical protein BGO29_13845 [Bacteroidales bacterium 36-12]